MEVHWIPLTRSERDTHTYDLLIMEYFFHKRSVSRNYTASRFLELLERVDGDMKGAYRRTYRYLEHSSSRRVDVWYRDGSKSCDTIPFSTGAMMETYYREMLDLYNPTDIPSDIQDIILSYFGYQFFKRIFLSNDDEFDDSEHMIIYMELQEGGCFMCNRKGFPFEFTPFDDNQDKVARALFPGIDFRASYFRICMLCISRAIAAAEDLKRTPPGLKHVMRKVKTKYKAYLGK